MIWFPLRVRKLSHVYRKKLNHLVVHFGIVLYVVFEWSSRFSVTSVLRKKQMLHCMKPLVQCAPRKEHRVFQCPFSFDRILVKPKPSLFICLACLPWSCSQRIVQFSYQPLPPLYINKNSSAQATELHLSDFLLSHRFEGTARMKLKVKRCLLSCSVTCRMTATVWCRGRLGSPYHGRSTTDRGFRRRTRTHTLLTVWWLNGCEACCKKGECPAGTSHTQ